MTSTSTLTFLWTPWSAGLSIGVVLLGAGLCFMAWRRSGYARAQGLLEIFRLALIALMAFVLNQPEWVEEFRPEEKPAVAVLWDNSPSMETRDVPLSAGTTGAITRREAIAKLIDDATWAPLRERMNVIVQPFSGPAPGQRTDLYEPLAQAPEKIKNLAGV
ncbi:MAG TPA: hypothetical protein VH120_03165, partial [Gemmataceae bacterium]|nr:hypothetical protein [Gemmataceae bacterium]